VLLEQTFEDLGWWAHENQSWKQRPNPKPNLSPKRKGEKGNKNQGGLLVNSSDNKANVSCKHHCHDSKKNGFVAGPSG
jgi:hypothetical protein